MTDTPWESWSAADIEPRVHRTVTFRFEKNEYRFALSQDLFSSHEIDTGSRLLLAELQTQNPGPVSSVYDIGCGVGVLGIVAASEYSAQRLVLEDRDALAVRFAARNAAENGLPCQADAFCRPAGAAGCAYPEHDLVLSNVPAKAGEPVRRALLSHALASCRSTGVFVSVLVQPLADETERMLHDIGVSDLHRINHAGHAVFLARPAPDGPSVQGSDGQASYRRGSSVNHNLEQVQLAAQPYWGLGEFETPSFQTGMALKLIDSLEADRHLVIWNPGVGIVPAWCRKKYTARQCTFASDDSLQILATVDTLQRNRSRRTRMPLSTLLSPSVQTLHACMPDRSALILVLDAAITPGQRGEIDELCRLLGERDCVLLVAGHSGEVSRFERQPWASVVRRSRSRGLRGMVLRIRQR